jgi:hypothetical protein
MWSVRSTFNEVKDMAELESLSAVGAALVGIGGAMQLSGENVASLGLVSVGLMLWGLVTLATKFVNK